MNGSDLKKEFGDYQTPNQFAETICSLLYNELKLNPEVVIEPTSGLGNFIKAALNTFSTIKKIVGVEINPEYCDECKKRISDDRLHIVNDNFFTYKIEKYVGETETLFLGNPPWATNSELNFNLPEQGNVLRDAFAIIEKQYPCTKLHVVHELLISAEGRGGNVRTSIDLMIEDVEVWKRQVYGLQKDKKTERVNCIISIIGAVAVCCMTLYMLDSTKSAMDIALDLTVFQLGPVQVSSFLFVLVCFFAFYASNKKLTSDWLEQKMINEKLVLDAYARVKAYDGKKSEKRSVLMSLPFFIMAVVGVVLSEEVISVVCGVIGVLVLTASRLVYSMAKKDVEGALYQILPEWMFDMALLLQTNNVQVALAKSIESAETLLKQELMELVERITDDPENIQSYLMFFKNFDVPEIATCMKMLYSISVAGSGNVEKQLTDLVGHVHKMEEKAMEQQGKNIAFKAHMITLYPVGATSAKILVDMMCGTIMFFQIFSAAL